jgi:hypothetical protein
MIWELPGPLEATKTWGSAQRECIGVYIEEGGV